MHDLAENLTKIHCMLTYATVEKEWFTHSNKKPNPIGKQIMIFKTNPIRINQTLLTAMLYWA